MTEYFDMPSDRIRKLIRRKVREYQLWEGIDTDEARRVRETLKRQINSLSAVLAAREAQLFLL
jgi:hypothetical protein